MAAYPTGVLRCLVPLRPGPSAKLRLAHVLSAREREELADTMAEHVVSTLEAAGLPVELITQSGGLNRALRGAVTSWPVLIVPADLPWITVEDVLALLDVPGDVVVALAVDGGTTALLARRPLDPAFGRSSGLRHLASAHAAGYAARGVSLPGFREDLDDERALRRALGRAPAFL